jgi:hypothetical protein
MRCLYCDRPLALLKRLTGDGEFCSKEHRKIYQREDSQLALARLLEAQPHARTKPGAGRPAAVKPEPEAPAPPKAPETSQPEAAGFFSEEIKARAASDVLRSTSAPLFESGGETALPGARYGESSGPKTAQYVPLAAPQPRFTAASPQRQEKPSPKQPVYDLRLEQGPPGAQAGVAVHLEPGRAGLLSSPPAPLDAPGKVRRAVSPRFLPLGQSRAAARAGAASPAVRPAKFIPGAAVERTEPGKVRSTAEPRWKPLEPALPEQEPGKITRVVEAFLERPVRPANQGPIPEIFEILFQPVSFPPYVPRMGCLEERLHRTDRIGFSPP